MDRLLNDNVIIAGHRIACGVHGAVDGEPVVLLHGTPASSLVWRRVAPAIAEAGHRVHLFDLLGFGASERPVDPAVDTSVSAQLPILLALLDHWQLTTSHVVGHDIGGAVAMQLGILHQDRLRSLTLIDCVSFDSWPSPTWRAHLAAGLDPLLRVPSAEHRRVFAAQLLNAVHDRERLSADGLDAHLDHITGPIGQASFVQHQLRHYDSRHTNDFADRLPRLAALPVQIVWGADDAWQPASWSERLHAAIPGARLDVIDACGHFAMEDQPEAVTSILLRFLDAQRV